MTKRGFTVLLAVTLFSAGCEKNDSRCGGPNPAQDLLWLKEEIKTLSQSLHCQSVSRSIYKNQTVFIIGNCEAGINSVPSLYDCAGNRISLSPSEYQDLKFTGEIELIWKSK